MLHDARFWLDRVTMLGRETNEAGYPLLALALLTIVRGSRQPAAVRSMLVNISMSLVDLCDAVRARQ